jgi:iron complex outermembrane receptor protein
MLKSKQRKHLLLALSINGVLAGLATPLAVAAAESTGGIEEVIVTAQKREERLQETPISIGVFEGDDFAKMGGTSFADVIGSSPSLFATPYPSSTNTLTVFMRGQGAGDAGQITKDGGVGLYVDGFYIPRLMATTFDVADIDRIEILRGPQGTLYGRNTTGGAVNMISKEPTGQSGFKGDVTYGNYGTIRALASVDMAAIHDFAIKVTGVTSSNDGFVKNVGAKVDNQNNYDLTRNTAGRIDVKYAPAGSALSAKYSFETGTLESTPMYYQNAQVATGCAPVAGVGVYEPGDLAPSDGYAVGCGNGAAGLGIISVGGTSLYNPDTYGFNTPASQLGYNTNRFQTWRSSNLPLSKADYNNNGLTLNYAVSDSLTIKSMTGYRKLDTKYYQDYGDVFLSAVPYYGIAFATGFLTADAIVSKTFSEELQAIGSFGDSLRYVFGAFYSKEDGTHEEFVNVKLQAFGIDDVTDRNVEATSTSQAAYGQVTWSASDKMDLIFGARYTKDKRSASRTYDVICGPNNVPNMQNSLNLLGGVYIGAGCGDGGELATIPQPGVTNGSGEISSSHFDPAFTLNYKWNRDLDTYFRFATGYRAGGFSESTPTFLLTFQPEKLTSYEVGLKSAFFNRRAQLNIAAFHSDYKNQQLDLSVNASDLSQTGTYNAGQSKIDGGELELTLVPMDDLKLTFSDAYLKGSVKSVDAVCGTIFNPYIPDTTTCAPGAASPIERFALGYLPKNNYSIGADYTFLKSAKGSFFVHADLNHHDKAYGTSTTGPAVPNSSDYLTPAHSASDARLGYTADMAGGGTVMVSLWCKNCGDTDYPAHVIGNGDPLAGYYGQAVARAWPRTFGVNLNVKY